MPPFASPRGAALLDAFLAEALPPEEARQRLRRVAVRDFPSGRALLALDRPERVLAAAEVLVRLREASRASSGTFSFINRRTLLETLAQRLLHASGPLTREEAVHLAEAAGQLTGFLLWHAPLGALLKLFEEHVAAEGLGDPLREALAKLERTPPSSRERPFAEGLQKLLAGEVPGESTEVEIRPGEAWADSQRGGLAALPVTGVRAWLALLEHCRSARGSAPSASWLRRAGDLVQAMGPEDLVRIVLETLPQIGRPGSRPIESRQSDWSLLDPEQSDLLRGLVWTTATLGDRRLIPLLGDAALACFQKIAHHGPRDVKVGNACLQALCRMGDRTAAVQLSRLLHKFRTGSIHRQIEKALDQLARETGMTPAELQEVAVPRFDMEEVGVRRQPLGGFTAEIRLSGAHGSELRFLAAEGKVQKAVPAAVRAAHPRELADLRRLQKEMQALLSAQSARLDQLYVRAAHWDLATWRERYLDHPLVGVLARRLIWRFDGTDDADDAEEAEEKESQLGIAPAGRIVNVRGEPLDELPPQTRVALWHPLESAPAEVLAWRRWLEEHEVRQPFKQAHREIYLLTDAERATGTYSNRFAAHILRQHAFAALCAQRGWSYRLQGQWDSWNVPSRSLPEHDLEVEFQAAPPEGGEAAETGVYLHLTTDRVSVRTLSGAPRLLAEVPPLLFSELMRDVDLFVSVTSLGNDPDWPESVAGRFQSYWRDWSHGDLDASAATRREALEHLLPRLKIAGRCTLGDRFLVVRGDLRTYKIHLGSAHVFLEPNDRYLCIVPTKSPAFFLPFEGDSTFALLLSKVFLLAEDTKIVDPVILRQLG